MSFLPYHRSLENGIVITSTRPEHAEQLQALQDLVFPTLALEERFRAPHYLRHMELFPEGQFVALQGARVVGMTTTIRLHFDFEHTDHTFADIIQGGWLTSHQPDGVWLYGADIGTHPDVRRLGVGRALYEARRAVVRALGLRGQVTVGMMSGYGALADRMTPQEYFEGLRSGSQQDPTISAQLRVGFRLERLLENYLNDPVCRNCGVLLVWEEGTEGVRS